MSHISLPKKSDSEMSITEASYLNAVEMLRINCPAFQRFEKESKQADECLRRLVVENLSSLARIIDSNIGNVAYLHQTVTTEDLNWMQAIVEGLIKRMQIEIPIQGGSKHD